MNILLVMNLSGTCMFILYLLFRYGLGKKIGENWQYLILRITILYFLIPLPFLKFMYTKVWKRLKEVLDIEQSPLVQYTYFREGVIVIDDGKWILNDALKMKFFLIFLGVVAVLGLSFVLIRRYLKEKKYVAGLNWSVANDSDIRVISNLKKKHGIKRKIQLFTCDEGNVSFTMGMWKPIIVYSANEDCEMQEMLLEHELVHTKRLDSLWQFFVLLILCIHWYNPFVWILRNEWSELCEQSCDCEVLKGRNPEAAKKYIIMLIRNTTQVEDKGKWKIAFRKRGNKMKKRVNRIIDDLESKYVKWSKTVSVLLVLGITLLNTVTVFAYEDIQYRYVGNTEEGNNKELASGYLTGDVIFVEEGYEGEYEGVWQEFMEIYDQVVLYDVQFIDEEGNIYPINTDVELCKECTHVYKNGEVSEHVVNEDGQISERNMQGLNIKFVPI